MFYTYHGKRKEKFYLHFDITYHGIYEHDLRKETEILVKPLFKFTIVVFNMMGASRQNIWNEKSFIYVFA